MKENTIIDHCTMRDGKICGICKNPIDQEIEEFKKYLEFNKDIKRQKRDLQRKVNDYRQKYVKINIDHKIPKSKGGANNRENYQLAHVSCNQQKGDKIIDL